MNLDTWLNNTEAMRKGQGLANACGDRSTNRAFAFNSTIGVEKARADNVWVNGWDGEEDVGEPNLDRTGYGLYVYMPQPPLLLQRLNQPRTTHQSFANDEITNDG